MTNKYLIAVSLIASIIMMAGAASAEILCVTDEHGLTIDPSYRVVDLQVDGPNVTITYLPPGDPGDAGIGAIALNVSNTTITSVTWPEDYSNANWTIANIGWPGSWGDFNVDAIDFPNPASERTIGPVVITFAEDVTLIPNEMGKYAAVHVISLNTTDTPSVKVTNGVCGGGEIPEFPTVALPIAAIIGLSFIFLRRKE